MPLNASLPVIDDRRFEELLEEARARVPRYTPEWTDLNDNDLGMAFLQMSTWLAEMQMFRMSRVPALNYIKFLELIGIELQPAAPAVAQISFPVLPTVPRSHVVVPARTRLSPDETDEDGRPVIFETDRALIAMKANLVHVQAFDGVGYRIYSAENRNTTTAYTPFGPGAVEGSAVLFGFDAELPARDIVLTVWTPGLEDAIPVHQCVAEPSAVVVSAELEWEYWAKGNEWQPLDLLKDESGRLTRSGEIHLKGPAEGEMQKAPVGNETSPAYWIRARIASNGYERAPSILAMRTNTVTATQAETVEFEIVGGSDGTEDQLVRLNRSPVLAGSLLLEIDEGSGYKTWEERPDFFGSRPDDPHYVLNRTTGEIQFGDDRRGRVPVANPADTSNMRARRYRVGGGTRGNLGADKLVSLLGNLDGIDAAAITNPFPSGGGQDEESLQDAKDRAPQTLRNRDRAVSVGDFESLAKQAGNIKRTKALPLYHPGFPGVEVPGVVSIIVVPDVPTDENPRPTPSEGTLQTVCAYLNDRRLLTTELFVTGPTYREVTISATLTVSNDADLGEVKNRALAELNRYFDPLIGGEHSTLEQEGIGWPFGGDIYYSLVFRRLLFDGVLRVDSLAIQLDDDVFDSCTDVALDDGMLLTNGHHDIEVRYDADGS